MFHHKNIEEKISAIFDGHYNKNDVASIEAHLIKCSSCRRFRKDIESLSQTMKKWMDDVIPKELERNINSLPKMQKEAITLLEYHQLSYEKIAHILNCNPSKIPPLIYKTRKRLLSGNPIDIFIRQHIHKILILAVIGLFIHIVMQIVHNERAVKYILNIKDKHDSIISLLNETVNMSSNETIRISTSKDNVPGEETPPAENATSTVAKPENRFSTFMTINTVSFVKSNSNDYIETSEKNRSQFPLNVKNRSYNLIRQFIDSGRMPPESSVRIEELLNEFFFAYPNPKDKPLIITCEVMPCAWNRGNYLLMIGLRTNTMGEKRVILKESLMNVIFDTNAIKSYRLIGYNRYKSPRGATVNSISAGEDLLSDYTLTTIYEMVPNNLEINLDLKDHLASSSAVVTVTLRGRDVDNDALQEFTQNIYINDFSQKPSPEIFFAAGVVEAGLLLKNSPLKGEASYEQAITTLKESITDDITGKKQQFIDLLKKAKTFEQSQ